MNNFYNQDYFPTPDHLIDRMIEKLGNYRRWNTYVDETKNGYTSVGRNGTMPEAISR